MRQGENIPRIFSWGAYGGGILLPGLRFIYSFNKHRVSPWANGNAGEVRTLTHSATVCRGRRAWPPLSQSLSVRETSSLLACGVRLGEGCETYGMKQFRKGGRDRGRFRQKTQQVYQPAERQPGVSEGVKKINKLKSRVCRAEVRPEVGDRAQSQGPHWD